MNTGMNLFNDNVIHYFRKIKKIDKNRFPSKEKSSGGNVNEPQLSTSEFLMKEG
jgi:hypothetical protein